MKPGHGDECVAIMFSERSRKVKPQLDMNKVARALGAERKGKVSATGGYFGAIQVLADVEARFGVPVRGGRPTNPRRTKRRPSR